MTSSKDLTGKKFGLLTVVKRSDKRSRGAILWECNCDCGTKGFYANGTKLKSHNTSSCGCLRRKYRDLTGQKFGLLTVIKKTDKRKHGYVLWECNCDCGAKGIYATSNSLLCGNKISCGCASAIARKKNAASNFSEFVKNDFVYGTRVSSMFRERANKNNKVGLKGVSKRKKDGKFLAVIGFQGNTYFLGSFETKEEAYKARKEAEKILYKDVLELLHKK